MHALSQGSMLPMDYVGMGGAPVYKGLMRTVTSATPDKRFGFATCCMPPSPSQVVLYRGCMKQPANGVVGDVCLNRCVCWSPRLQGVGYLRQHGGRVHCDGVCSREAVS